MHKKTCHISHTFKNPHLQNIKSKENNKYNLNR